MAGERSPRAGKDTGDPKGHADVATYRTRVLDSMDHFSGARSPQDVLKPYTKVRAARLARDDVRGPYGSASEPGTRDRDYKTVRTSDETYGLLDVPRKNGPGNPEPFTGVPKGARSGARGEYPGKN